MPEHHILNPVTNLCAAKGFNAVMDESHAGGWAPKLSQMRLLISAVSPLSMARHHVKGHKLRWRLESQLSVPPAALREIIIALMAAWLGLDFQKQQLLTLMGILACSCSKTDDNLAFKLSPIHKNRSNVIYLRHEGINSSFKMVFLPGSS